MEYPGPLEVALTTDLRGEPYSFALWDVQTGAQLVLFKGIKGKTIPKCLQMIDDNYFVTANDNMLHFWSIFNKKCQDQKLFLPGRPSALCVSPCGNFIAVGINELIHTWHMRTGSLLVTAQRHFQSVSVLKFDRNGIFLISGGEDGHVLVWPFADLISNVNHLGAMNRKSDIHESGVNEPRFTWIHHSSQITDIHITNGPLCVTASSDASANLYNYIDGTRLFSFNMPVPIWSVVMDKSDTRIFLGASNGDIYEVCVSSISLSLVNYREKDSDDAKKPVFKGHAGKVISLRVSLDGTKLISASLDSSCKIWDVNNRKMLQDIKHQAPLANLTTFMVPDGFALTAMTQSLAKPPLQLKPLKRTPGNYKMSRDVAINLEDLFDETCTPLLYVKNIDENRFTAESGIDTMHHDQEASTRTSKRPRLDLERHGVQEDDYSDNDDNHADAKTVKDLRKKLKELYHLATKKLFNDAMSARSLKPFDSLIKDHD